MSSNFEDGNFLHFLNSQFTKNTGCLGMRMTRTSTRIETIHCIVYSIVHQSLLLT